MQDNSVFSTAVDFVNNTLCHIFLTGKAGTGKTTFLKYIKENTPKKCVVVAPTGVAAINAGGVTMHSLFQLPFGPYVPVVKKSSDNGLTDKHALFKNIRMSEEKRQLLQDLQLLIIDEVSMVRCDTLDAIDAILRHFRKKPDVVFGGVQVLYIGDLFQLPPVMPEAEWAVLKEYYESPFFFHSQAIRQAQPVYIELKKIYRQNEKHFIELLNKVRNAETEDADLAVLNLRYGLTPEKNANYITLTSHNYKADKINADELKKLSGKLREFKGTVEGDFPDKTLPTEIALQLKEKAQVMFIRNDTSEDRKYFNGKIATVKKIDDEGITVIFSDTKQEFLLEKETWNNIRYSYNALDEKIEEEKLGSFTQYPIRLAWAITIHKSQGLTFEHAIIDAGESFAAGQVYVALSRCTSLDGLVLHSKILAKNISTHEQVLAFAKKEIQTETLGQLLEGEKRIFTNTMLLQVFDLQNMVEDLRDFADSIPGKKIPDVKVARVIANTLLDRASELQRVALKFQEQLNLLLREDHKEKLIERITKAIEFFTTSLNDTVLQPLDNHILSLKGVSKVKKYLKEVRMVRINVARKIESIQNVHYGDVTFGSAINEIKVRYDDDVAAVRKSKRQKGESLNDTLELLKSGKNKDEIATARQLAVSTVEGHIAQLVKSGLIEIEKVIEATKLSKMLEVFRDTKTKELSLTQIKQQLGEEFSFGELRATQNYLYNTGEIDRR